MYFAPIFQPIDVTNYNYKKKLSAKLLLLKIVTVRETPGVAALTSLSYAFDDFINPLHLRPAHPTRCDLMR